MFYKLQIILWLCLMSVSVHAQYVISGTVTDEKNEPLPGVSIAVKGTSWGTGTDANGRFVLRMKDNQPVVLVCSYVGFSTREAAADKTTNELTIVLTASQKQLDQVVISAGKYQQEVKRLTVSTDVIKPYIIENKATINIENILNQLPSVNVIDGQVNIRGGSGWSYGAGSRVMITLDDMPFLSGDAGSAQWKFLPVENLEQIEVIKGASSVLYGSSALNGIINLRTADPGKTPKTSVQLQSGIYDRLPRDSSRWSKTTRWQSAFNAFHAQRFGRLDATLMLNYLNDQGYRLGEDDRRLRVSVKTRYRNKKIPGLQYGINGSLMQQNSSSFLLWESYTLGYTALDSSTTLTRARLISIDPHLDYYRNGIKHKLRLRYNSTFNTVEEATPGQNQDNSFINYFGEYQAQKELGRNRGMLIAGVMSQYTISNSPLYNGTHTLHNAAPYLQLDYRIRQLSISLGTRYEYFSMNDKVQKALIFRSGINYGLSSSTFVRASWGQGYRFPSIAEKYITTSVGQVNIFPNEQLQPERGWSAELGIKQGLRVGKWQGYIDLAYFHTEFDNMVEFNFGVWSTANSTLPINIGLADIGFRANNIGRTRINGIDVVLAGEGKINDIQVRMLAGYTFTNPVTLNPDFVYAVDSLGITNTFKSTSEDTVTELLKYRYQHLAKADVEIEYKKFILGYSVRYNSYMTNVDKALLDPVFIPGIDRGRALNPNGDWIHDVRVGYKATRRLKIQALINNLTNHEQMTRPADLRPPRMFILQLQYAI